MTIVISSVVCCAFGIHLDGRVRLAVGRDYAGPGPMEIRLMLAVLPSR